MLIRSSFHCVLLATGLGLSSSISVAQDAGGEETVSREDFLAQFDWQEGEIAELGDVATIETGPGIISLGGDGALQLLQGFGNLIDQAPEGIVGPVGLDWFLVFQFDPSGYVKDDEKDELDPDKMLEEIIAQEKISNKSRESYGLPASHTTGWAKEPFYNPETNNLEWGIRFQNEGSVEETVNYQTKLLGRKGVMSVILVCEPDDLDMILPVYQDLLYGFEYNSGEKYAEYKDGDKLAEYGLTALVVGGAAAVGAKLGFFAWIVVAFKKFGKFIAIGVVAIGVFLKKLFTGKSGE